MMATNEELRELIKQYIENGNSYYRLAKETSVSNANEFKKFVKGEKDFMGKTYESIYNVVIKD